MKSWGWLRSWPLLVAAVVALATGTRLSVDTTTRAAIGLVLVTLGAVCLGAWIALLSAHDYTGRDPANVDPSGVPTPSTPGRVDPVISRDPPG